MNIERLRKASAFLRSYDKRVAEITRTKLRFHILEWVEPGVDLREGFCETAACAIGSMALHPQFIADGLVLNDDCEPAYDDVCNWPAVEKYFDITQAQSSLLFQAAYYVDELNLQGDDETMFAAAVDKVTPNDVADRIDQLIASHTTA